MELGYKNAKADWTYYSNRLSDMLLRKYTKELDWSELPIFYQLVYEHGFSKITSRFIQYCTIVKHQTIPC